MPNAIPPVDIKQDSGRAVQANDVRSGDLAQVVLPLEIVRILGPWFLLLESLLLRIIIVIILLNDWIPYVILEFPSLLRFWCIRHTKLLNDKTDFRADTYARATINIDMVELLILHLSVN